MLGKVKADGSIEAVALSEDHNAKVCYRGMLVVEGEGGVCALMSAVPVLALMLPATTTAAAACYYCGCLLLLLVVQLPKEQELLKSAHPNEVSGQERCAKSI